MGDVICLNKVREERKAKQAVLPQGILTCIDPEDAELFSYFTNVLEGFKSHGYRVVELLVVPYEGEIIDE